MSFETSGVIDVPANPGSEAGGSRLYAIRADGQAFLLTPTVSEGSPQGLAWILESVPPSAQEAIRAQHPGRSLTFPPASSESGGDGRTAKPSPVPLLHVDPTKIDRMYTGPDLREMVRTRGEVLDGDWDLVSKKRFSDTHLQRAVEECLLQGKPWEETAHFKSVAKQIEKGAKRFGCTTVEQLSQRGEQVLQLAEEIRTNGYRTRVELRQGKLFDEVRVAIDRDGRFMFLDGRHRLAIARVLGLPEIPVYVSVRHRSWEDFRDKIRAYAERRDGLIYQIIDHPDLAEFPAHHGTGRISLLRNALSDYPCEGKRLLDIGTHWGYMAQQMERLGFDCVGVESNRTCATIAARIGLATESRFKVWRGDIFDYPDPGSHDVVLALNIFHHLIKTEELHRGLEEFLHRLNAELIFFEPHAAGAAQMRGAYRNYEPDEFAEFVAGHAGMSSTEFIGRAEDGRPIFKIAR
jgi:2-polyprenyl-3-methyl-5-hydroxy-6-metoxy-1,4-benzoquinol methylase